MSLAPGRIEARALIVRSGTICKIESSGELRESWRSESIRSPGQACLSAKGDRDSVLPDMNAIRLQCDLMEKLGPQLGCLGSHHTHPYDSAEEVKAVEGWNPSRTDRAYFTGEAFRELRHRVSLITTVCKSSASGNKASQFEFERGRAPYRFSLGARHSPGPLLRERCLHDERP